MFDFFTEKEFFGNSLLDYVISVAILVLAVILGRFMIWLGNEKIKKRVEKTPAAWDDVLYNVFQLPFVCGMVLLVLWIAIIRLDYPDKIDGYLVKIFKFLAVMDVTWILVRLSKTLCDHYMMPKATHGELGKLDKNVVLTIKKALSFLLWTVGLLVAIESIGVNIAALLTTLGIGGVAVALASQDTVKNIIGGITVFVDKTFRMGDRIRVAGYDGHVEDIGIRSTRIRTLDGFLVTIPNYQVVEGAVENISLEPARKIILQLGLTYDTTPEQMQQAMDILKKTPSVIKDIQQDIVVSFMAFADSSLNITFIYYIRRGKDYYNTQNAVNMYILQQFNSAGLNFAFPSVTVYNG